MLGWNRQIFSAKELLAVSGATLQEVVHPDQFYMVQINIWCHKAVAAFSQKECLVGMATPLLRRISLPEKIVFVALTISLMATALSQADENKTLSFVRDGKAGGVIVIPEDGTPSVRQLAEYFSGLVARSTGTSLPIVTDDHEREIAVDRPKLFLGECRQTLAAGLKLSDLRTEEYRIAVRDNAIFILGEPAKPIMRPGTEKDPWYCPDPMRWALNDLLTESLGVRWLWPGHLGTYVPKHRDFSIAATDRTYRPRLKMRNLIVATMRDAQEKTIRAEALEWVSNHQGGERDEVPLTHGFNDWWERFHVTHPDYFAQPPAGLAQRKAGYVKLNLTNPKVLDQIAEDYEKAGKPKYWNVTPNDGIGFDVSESVRTWDIPANQSPEDIWMARGNLTARYVKWWNMIYERLSALNPDVRLITMAYSCYRTPPPAERPLTAKAIIGIVPSYRAYDVWSGWAAQTDELILRPNWGHYGANGPHLALKEVADYMKYAWANKMVGFYLDSILGFWGTQGLNYYLCARLMVDPDLSVDTIIGEYASAFGRGAPKVEEYFRYWQALTTEWAHGHKVNKDANGKYDALIRENKIMDNPLIGPRQALPFIYTDEVLAKAYGMLDEAAQLIGDTDAEASQRVTFLRQGLDELKLSRDCIALGRQVEKKPTPELMAEFTKKATELEALRTALTPSHVIWGGPTTRRENKTKIKIRPANLSRPSSTGDDQF